MKAAVLLVALVGCAVDAPDYDLSAVRAVEIAHGADAVRIVASVYGIPADGIRVHWAIDPLPPSPEGAVDGVALGCDLWVSWWGPSWTSGASADGPAISYTALAHEVAHCALSRAGQDDPRHERADWWGADGRVAQADEALERAGL